jgi:transcriptional regulator with PAS, ATPase and Fis domain
MMIPVEQAQGFEAFEGMLGSSDAMRDVFSRLIRIAPFYRTALVTGETGTGKELAARALHRLSPVRSGHFVTVNCSAVVETLFESELFGHVRGSFTGAAVDKMGLFEYANGGTLFLDEIGDMPLSTQAKLLRALQNQEVLRVGSLTPKKVDVRVIAATNKNLRDAVRDKTFREDLFYRLSMVEVDLPPLRERQGDVPTLALHSVAEWCQRFRRQTPRLSDEVMFVLNAHRWPGNVRELDNAMGHACMMFSEHTIEAGDLPDYLHSTRLSLEPTGEPLPMPDTLSTGATDVMEEYESRLVHQALEQSANNQTHAARLLRTTRDRLRYKMKKYGLLQETHDQNVEALVPETLRLAS